MKKYSEIKQLLEEYESRTGFSRTISDWIDLEGVLHNLSYLFHDFKNIKITYNSGTEEEYTKELSPLFYSGYIEDPDYWSIFRTIVDDIPFYFKETTIEVADNPVAGGVSYKTTPLLPQNRDSGILDVPSALQNSSFYQTWFRDVQGYINNKLVLDVYNKLNLPVINENNYLNFDLFVKYAEEVYNKDLVNNLLLDFKSIEDYEGIERVGTQEYLDEIVEEKLITSKDLIYYTSDQADVLSSWAESVYNAGLMDQDKLQKEKLVYRLQDLKHELFRRKFAGSSTLYNLILNSINRQGSLVTVAPAARVGIDLTVRENFNDKRFIRLVSVPGISTTYFNVNDYFNPIDVFYKTPLQDGRTVIPLDTLIPLFYTSSFESALNGSLSGEYSSRAYRGNISVIEWDQAVGISASQSVRSSYPTFDEKIHATSEEGELITYLSLDSEIYRDSADPTTIALDMEKPVVSLADTTGSVFDISANKLLYHKNTLQKLLDSQYPYLTYPISNGASISLLDTQWISYLEKAIQQKSRVQDETQIGVQFSDYSKRRFTYQTANFSYFTMKYEDENEETVGLYYNDLKVRFPELVADYLPTPQLFTKISLANKVLEACERIAPEQRDTVYEKLPEEYRRYNVGILPFTYNFGDLSPEAIAGLKYGIYPEEDYYNPDEESNKHVFFDDYSERGFAKAYFLFSNWDILTGRNDKTKNLAGFLGLEPIALDSFLNTASPIKMYLTTSPTRETRVVYYIVQKYLLDENGNIQYLKDDSGKSTNIPLYTYNWSDPIPVFWQDTVQDIFGSLDAKNTVKPDWWALGIHINPYLNFTQASASALRHKPTIPSYQVEKIDGHLKLQEGASDVTGLCNLSRFRQFDKFCNDVPEEELDEITWIPREDTFTYTGTYLRHYRGKQAYLDRLAELIAVSQINRNNIVQDVVISGDNRVLDVLDDIDANRKASDVYYDKLGVACINIKKAEPITGAQNNKVFPDEHEYDEEHTSLPNRLWFEPGVLTGKDWWWSKLRTNINTGTESNGFALCFNVVALPEEDVEDTEMVIFYQDLEETAGKIEVSLQLENNNTTARVKFIAGLEEIVSDSFTLDFNLRIGCSYYQDRNEGISKLLLVVNNSVVEKNLDVAFEDLLSDEKIHLFETATKEHRFYGNLYDLRVYNDGLDSFELLLSTRGTLRELFSYGPSIYKLASALYSGSLAYSKEVGIRAEATDIKYVRLLNRDLWDTIMVDPYPLIVAEINEGSLYYKDRYYDPYTDPDVYSLVKVKNPEDDTVTDLYTLEGNCIQQKLKDNIEAINTSAPIMDASKDCILRFNGRTEHIQEKDAVSIIMSTLYPVNYKRWPYVSFDPNNDDDKPSLLLDENNYISTPENSGISMPRDIISADDNIEYSADLDLNFYLEPKSDLSKWYSHGINVDLKYNEKLGRTTAYLIQKEGTSITSDNDHILVPFVIPRQKNTTSTQYGYIDRLKIKDFELCNEIKELLRAQNYYTELEIPLVYQEDNLHNVYARRWDALRTLKEGTYYFTCKYPVQILPFLDIDTNSLTSTGKFANLFATCRFKIVVKGTPKVYSGSVGKISKKYIASNILQTLRDPGYLVDPEDNREFPHRFVDIDLYVLDAVDRTEVSEDFAEELFWTKVASNYDNEAPIKLTKETLSSSTLSLTTEIPLFLHKTYTTPFFVADEDGKQPKPDWINPILINSLNNGALQDRLLVKQEEDLDFITLTAGKTYKLLFEYTGRITEIAYHEGSFVNSTEGMKEELLKTAQLVNLLEDPLYTSEYCYTTSGRQYVENTIITGIKGGYRIIRDGDNVKFAPITEVQNISNIEKFDFGDPYSRSTAKNYLLTVLGSAIDSHKNIDNAYAFTYQVEDNYPKTSKEVNYKALSSLTVPRSTDNFAGTTVVNFSEETTLADLHSVLLSRVQELFSGLKIKREGLFSELSEISPDIIYPELATFAKYSFIRGNNEDLVSYRASDRILPVSNKDILVERKGLYSNNLLVSRNFVDKYYWNWRIVSGEGRLQAELISEETQDKDICSVLLYSTSQQSNASIELSYTPSSSMSITSAYEIALLVSQETADQLESIEAQLQAGNNISITTLTREEELSGGYCVFSGESEETTANQVKFVFKYSSLPEAEEGIEILRLATAIVRRRPSPYREYQGFSDSNTSDDEHRLHIFGHHVVLFKNKYADILTPVQFDNELYTVGHELSATVQRNIVRGGSPVVTQDFIEANSLRPLAQYSPYMLLRKAWLRRLYLSHVYEVETVDGEEVKISRTSANFRTYRVGTDYLGLRKLVLSLESKDLYELCTSEDGKDGIYFRHQAITDTPYFSITSGNGIGLRFRKFDDETLKVLQHSNLKLDTFNEGRYYVPEGTADKDVYGTFSLENEKISLLVNSFNSELVRKNEASPIAVTNVQLLTADVINTTTGSDANATEMPKVAFEYEFLPIIYDETTQHLSLNMFIHFEK